MTSRWQAGDGNDEGRERYAYVTPSFAMGSTSATYTGTAQFKPFDIQLDAARGSPTLTVVTREAASATDDDPYGFTKRKDRSGHDKPTHLPMHPVAAQERGLLLASVISDGPRDAPEELSTNVLFPMNLPGERVTLDGAAIEGSAPRSWPATVGAVLTVKVGGSAAAFRVVSADGCAGQSPVLRVELDEPGLAHHAGRLVVRHFQRAASAAWRPCHPRVTLVFVADAAKNDADVKSISERAGAPVTEKVEPTDTGLVWSARVVIGGVVLEAGRHDDFGADGRKHRVKDIVRTVNGAPMHFGVLEVNGSERAD